MPEIINAVALCAVGAEKTAANEIRKLGIKISESGFGQIRFTTGLSGLYGALIGLRTVDRVLLEAVSFEAGDFDALFEGARNCPWEDYIPKGMGLRVAKVRTNRSALEAETSIQAVVHKAAAERLCSKWKVKRLPDDGDQAELRIYLEKNRASVLLDLSGYPLFRRGYRTSGGIAPLRETTAAVILLHSGWRRKFPLYDPFCGSGTIAVEAAMYAWDIAPGLGRRFALEKLLLSDRGTERKAREEFLEKVDFSRLVRIAGSDSDNGAIASARANLERAIALAGKNSPAAEGKFENHGNDDSGRRSLRTKPSFAVLPMEEAFPPSNEDAEGAETKGFIVTNPPYGRRVGDTELAEKTYSEMAKLSRNFPGWKLVTITDHSGFESFFGRKADSCREITNGAIQSYLYQYEEI